MGSLKFVFDIKQFLTIDCVPMLLIYFLGLGIFHAKTPQQNNCNIKGNNRRFCKTLEYIINKNLKIL